jgi:hypothetical protein
MRSRRVCVCYALIQADGHAAQELAVAIKLLYDSNKSSLNGQEHNNLDSAVIRTNINTKVLMCLLIEIEQFRWSMCAIVANSPHNCLNWELLLAIYSLWK